MKNNYVDFISDDQCTHLKFVPINIEHFEYKGYEEKWILTIKKNKYVIGNDVLSFIKNFKEDGICKEEIKSFTDKQKCILNNLIKIGCFDEEEKDVKSKRFKFGNNGLWIKFNILNANSIKKLSFLKFLYNKFVVSFLICLILVTLGSLYYFNSKSVMSYTVQSLSYKEYILFILLGIGAVLFHEFGHISASLRYGVVPTHLGVGVYYISPVMFVDVNDTWTLGKKKRMVVDTGGVYFQLIYTVLVGILFMIFKLKIFLILATLLVTSVIFNLNPFLKYDGYWIFSDYLGVYNLNNKFIDIFKGNILWIKGRKERIEKIKSKWPRKIIIIISMYGFLSLLFYSYFTYKLIYITTNDFRNLILNFNFITLMIFCMYLFFSVKSFIALMKMWISLFK
ncbi:hypothetical protein ACOAKC_11830 [Hathewaya histolytica]|uniref:hypothetical protein n=1 Tax=Hathewaya histolytica TaxID=1498 RepID=UPI003B6787AF